MNLDKFFNETDFEAVSQRNEQKQEESNAEASALAEAADNNECEGGGCKI